MVLKCVSSVELNKMKVFLALVIITSFSPALAFEEGDPCTTPEGKRGMCAIIFKCPEAYDLLEQKRPLKKCGSVNEIPIVCCGNISGTLNSPGNYDPTDGAGENNPYDEGTIGYRSFEKCREYSRKLDCEKTGSDPVIFGGEPAKPKEFPHMVHLGYDSKEGIKWLCGGSLISEKYVLSAGHCLYSFDYSTFVKHARLGVLNSWDCKHRQDILITDRIKYPQYEPPAYYDDIAILKLERPAQFNAFVKPACLHLSRKFPNTQVIATGWGKTENVSQSDILMKVELKEKSSCRNYFRDGYHLKRGLDESTQVCVGAEGHDTCEGDSGGPIQIYSIFHCMFEIVGVTSFGDVLCGGTKPGMYTRVSAYVDWIEDIVWPGE